MYMGVGFRAKFDKVNSGNPGAGNFTREFIFYFHRLKKN